MSTTHFGDLEVLSLDPTGKQRFDTPLLFVHGAYVGAWCWEEHYLPYFASRGFHCLAVSLSGHGGTRRHLPLDGFSISDYVDDLSAVIEALDRPPALIGHSMGGFVVQKYLEKADVPAAVLLCAVPPHGLLHATLGMMMAKPSLLVDLNRMMQGTTPPVESVAAGLFHQPMPPEALLRLAMRAQPESHRAIWDMTWFDLPCVSRAHRPPMLVLGAAEDQIIPPSQVEATAKAWGVDAHIFPNVGHGLMMETDWQAPATYIADWLAETVS